MATKTGVCTPMPLLRSTEGPTTRPCRLRFVNNFLYAVDVFCEPCQTHFIDELSSTRIDHEGTEKKYATVQPKGQSPQGTYTTHAWRVREAGSGRLLGTYVGEEATIEMTAAAACLVHKGFSPGEAYAKKTFPASWGKFRQRREVSGIPVRAFDCVSEAACERAAHVLQRVTEHMPAPLLERLRANHADVAVVGRSQAPSDLPTHSFLEGQDSDYDRQTCSCSDRGVGGSWTVPTAATGEENLLMEGDVAHPDDSTLVHHFAHSVMSIAMNEDQRQAVISAYFNARATQLYRAASPIIACADEYWAQGAQAWFEATKRSDVNDKINTRTRLRKRDPQLAALLENAFGDGEWRYEQTCSLQSRSHKASDLHELALRQLKARAGRYRLCCFPPWVSFMWSSHSDKASGKAT